MYLDVVYISVYTTKYTSKYVKTIYILKWREYFLVLHITLSVPHQRENKPQFIGNFFGTMRLKLPNYNLRKIS